MGRTNPLLQDFEIPPFSKIKEAHYKPAFKQALEEARQEINAISENPATPDFENTIEALEYSGYRLHRITALFFNLHSAETTPKIQKIAQEVSPWLSEFQNDLILNKKLFERVQSVYQKGKNSDLTPEENTLLEKHYKAFLRNGASLKKEEKEKLRKIDAQLAKLTLRFGENILADTNAFELHIENEDQLHGLPNNEKETAAEAAREKGIPGYLFTLHAPSYRPFMKYVENRKLREEMSTAYLKRGFQKNENNNEENILKITRLRFERAQLLGFRNHADFVLRERMAKTPGTVDKFLNDMLEKAKPAAKREFRELEDFARKKEGIDQLQKWDNAYYSHLLKKERFDLDDAVLKSYFELKNVIQGAFEVAHKLYGLNFEETQAVEKYHKDVKTYRVTDENGIEKALFYADFHPRSGKRGGAWMTSYKEQYRKNGKNERPIVSIVCNFSKPGKEKPALLTFNEVTTLFHEFGHSLHAILADTTYPSLSGTNVFWDFVELPSQVMENWCYEKESLERFAKHYETGELIPMEYIEKIKKSANFLEGMQTLRQLSFGLLDMAWHGKDPRGITDVKAYEEEAFQSTRQFPKSKENCMSASFNHIFQGGYSAGYYSYKWAEVLDADAFAYFKEKGIFNREVAIRFKDHLLSKGGTEDPALLYKRFRGREATNQALLKRAGLVN